jgi:hypothetical protein
MPERRAHASRSSNTEAELGLTDCPLRVVRQAVVAVPTGYWADEMPREPEMAENVDRLFEAISSGRLEQALVQASIWASI